MAFETLSLFDDLENDQTMQRVASRRALALADTRVEKHLGAFFRGAQSAEEFEARLALVIDDFDHYVTSAAEEIGYPTPEHIRETILASYRTASGEPCPNCGKPGGCDHGPGEHKTAAEPVQFSGVPEEPEEDGDAPEEKTSHFKWSVDSLTAPGQPSGAASTPPNGNMVGAPGVTPPVPNAATMVNPQMGGAAAVPTVPQGTTNPNADINDVGTMSQGGVPLAANAQMPGMQAQTPQVTGASKDFSPSDQKVDGEGASVLDALDESGPKTSHELAWKITGWQDGRDPQEPQIPIHPYYLQQQQQKAEEERARQQLLQQQSVANPHPGIAEWDAMHQQQSVAPPGFESGHYASEGNTDLGGPEPKIDKSEWTRTNPGQPDEGTSDSGRWPTKQKDIVKPIKAVNRDQEGHDLSEIGEKTTEHEKLPSNKDDAGFDNGGVNKGPHTKTFDGKGQVDPVTRTKQAASECELCSQPVKRQDSSVVDGLRLCPDCRGKDTPDANQTSELERQERQSSIFPDTSVVEAAFARLV